MTLKILHNNKCSKSRKALSVLEELPIDFEVVYYLDGDLSKNEIKKILKHLNPSAEDITRKKEKLWQEKFKNLENSLDEEEWIDILDNNPVLIERPIIYDNKGAVIGRDHKKLEDFLENRV